MAAVAAAGGISVFASWALLAGLFVGAAEAFVDASADQGTVAPAAAGGTIETLGRRDTADAHDGQDLMAGAPEDHEGMDGLAVPSDSAGRGAHFSSDGDGTLRDGLATTLSSRPTNGYLRHPDLAVKVVSEYDCGDDDRANPRGVHGTHVAGMVGPATDHGRGVAGMAPEADLDRAAAGSPIFVAVVAVGIHGVAYVHGP